MKTRLLTMIFLCFGILMIANIAEAQYSAPDGGWDYMFEGNNNLFTATGGTHVVNIYKDGETQANTFIVTAGQVNSDYEYCYLALGLGCTSQAGAMDVDFFGYKAGIHVPTATAVHAESAASLSEFRLSQNYPNPFNPSTVISFTIPRNNFVSLKVYDLRGAEIAEIAGREYSAGLHSLTFDASKLANGEYIYELKAEKYSISKKMLLLK